MTLKRKLLLTGLGSLGCLFGGAVSLILTQISMAYSWGTQTQLLPFRPWTGRMPSLWDVMVPLFGYAVSLFLFAAIILFGLFVRSLIVSSRLKHFRELNPGNPV